MFRRLLIILAIFMFICEHANSAELTVNVHNVTNKNGSIMVAIFNNAKNFPHGGYWNGNILTPIIGTTSVVFRDVPNGRYAVTAYHDINGNRKLDTNALGIPTEPVAFSNNAVGLNAAPTFLDASFIVFGKTISIDINLKKMGD